MFLTKICMAIVLLSLQATHSYILLTANLDDVHSLAKQLASSPVANQFNDIIRRASQIFNQHQDDPEKRQMRSDSKLDGKHSPTNRDKKRVEANLGLQSAKIADATTEYNVEVWIPDQKALDAELNAKVSDSSSGSSGEVNGIQAHYIVRRNDPDLAELGRNASFYLKSIKKIFEGF